MPALKELTICKGRQGIVVTTGVCTRVEKGCGSVGTEEGPSPSSEEVAGWNGGSLFAYFCKCLLSSHYMSGTSAETPKLHRSLASGEGLGEG